MSQANTEGYVVSAGQTVAIRQVVRLVSGTLAPVTAATQLPIGVAEDSGTEGLRVAVRLDGRLLARIDASGGAIEAGTQLMGATGGVLVPFVSGGSNIAIAKLLEPVANNFSGSALVLFYQSPSS